MNTSPKPHDLPIVRATAAVLAPGASAIRRMDRGPAGFGGARQPCVAVMRRRGVIGFSRADWFARGDVQQRRLQGVDSPAMRPRAKRRQGEWVAIAAGLVV